jgi:hypothetical protein
VIVTCISIAIGACGAEPESTGSTVPSETTSTTSNLGGDRLPVQIPGEEYGHYAGSLAGTIHQQDNGCWTVDLGDGDRLVVFPPDFTKAADGAAMVGPGGASFSDGTEVDAVGGIVGTEGFPGVPDGFWGSYFEFCEAAKPEIVVVDELTPAFDVSALPPDQLVALLQEADLSMSWGCGLGFTLSSPDQRVALHLTPNDYETVPSSPAAFPDEAWQATIMIGKNLMVHHCDDVLEGWEPEAIFAAEWPLISGTLEFDPPESSSCGAVGPVEAILSGIVVETPEGPVDIGDLTVVNEAYGCFAG